MKHKEDMAGIKNFVDKYMDEAIPNPGPQVAGGTLSARNSSVHSNTCLVFLHHEQAHEEGVLVEWPAVVKRFDR